MGFPIGHCPTFMQEALTILNTVTPFGVIALLVIIIWQLLDGRGFLSKIRGTQEQKYPEIEKHLNEIENAYEEQKKFRENHSMHEIPEIVTILARVEAKVDKMADIQYSQGLDIARLKALSEK